MLVPPKYREVLILRDIEELACHDTQAALQLPITTLKVRGRFSVTCWTTIVADHV